MEQGHSNRRSVTTRDINVKGHMKKVILPFFKTMGAIMRAKRILLAAVNMECLKEYERIVGKCLDHRTCCETVSGNVLHFGHV